MGLKLQFTNIKQQKISKLKSALGEFALTENPDKPNK